MWGLLGSWGVCGGVGGDSAGSVLTEACGLEGGPVKAAVSQFLLQGRAVACSLGAPGGVAQGGLPRPLWLWCDARVACLPSCQAQLFRVLVS